MPNPINLKDIIDISQDIDKLIGDFNKLEQNVAQSLKNIAEAGGKLKSQLSDVEVGIRKNVASTQSLKQSNDQTEKALKNNNEELSKLSKQYRESTQAVKNNEVVLSTLGKSLGDQKKRVKLLKEEYESLDPKIDGNRKRLSQLSTAISRTRAEIKKMSDASNRLNRTFDESKGSYNDLINQNSKIRSILNKLPQEFIETNKRAQQLQKTFAQNTEKLKAFDKSLGQNFRNVGNYGDAMGQLNGIASQAKQFLGAAGVAGAVGFLAKEFFEATKALEANKKATEKLFKGGQADIKAYTAQATALAQVFEKDFNQVLKAGNALSEQFGITGSESFDLIEESLIRGLDLNDDFLDQLSEYSTQFAEAGVEAGVLVETLILAEDKGIFSDKAADAVKEATIRLRELTPATQDAIRGLGLSVEQVQKDLRSGAKTSFDVIQDVSEALNKFPEQSQEVGTAIADIFGGPGEDAGLAFLKSLKDINRTTDDYRENLNKSQRAVADYLDSQRSLNAELLSLETNTATLTKQFKTFFNNLATFGLQVIDDLLSGFTSLDTKLTDFKKSISNVQDINVATDTLAQLNEELENSRKTFGTLIEEGNWGAAARRAIQLSQGVAGANQALQKQTELIIKIQETERRIAELQAEIEERKNKKARDAAKERIKISEDEARRRREAIREQQKLALEDQIELLQETADNEEATINERLAASQLITEKRIALAKLEKDSKLDVAKEFLQEELDLINDQNESAVFAARRAGEARADALFSAAEKAASDQDFQALIDQDLQNRLNAIETAKNAELLALEERKLNVEDKEEAIFQVEEEFRRKSLQATLNFLRNKKEIFAETEAERIEIAKQISEIELELARDTGDEKIDITANIKDKLVELEQTVVDAVNAKFDRQLERLDEQQAALEERLQFELDLTGENEDAKLKLQEEFAKKEEAIERERARLEQRKANFEKLRAIFKIGIDTAQGIAAQLPGLPFTAPLIALITALGAAQIAAVSSATIPAFAEGTENAPGGTALVGEEGQELIYDKKTGNARLTPDHPTLMDVPKGAVVFDAVVTKRMKADAAYQDKMIAKHQNKSLSQTHARTEKAATIIYEQTFNSGSGTEIDYNRLGKAVAKHIPPSQQLIFEKDGTVRTLTRFKDGSVKENLNKRSSLISKKHPINKELSNVKSELSKLKRHTK